jgi:hypothetical protein
LRFFYQNAIKSKQVYWTPETLDIISYCKGAEQSELDKIKKQEERVNIEHKNYSFNAERIPAWYYTFLEQYQSLNLIRGSITFSSNPALDVLCVKPKCLDGLFYVGAYSGITPESAPIFTNKDGEIFVFSAKEFRSYPRGETQKDIDEYRKILVPMIARWDNISDFLLQETQRLNELYLVNPSLYAVKNCAPSNLK